MQRIPDTVEILSERDSPLKLVASMQVGSSTKRKAQKPISSTSQKQRTKTTTRAHKEGTPQTGPSSLEVMDFGATAGVSIKDIPGYIPPSGPSAQAKKPTKNQRYHIRMLAIPQGMLCISDIVPTLM